eukprot:CAMPEP_0169197036 /NCGR_PEP_ID=MMETSP1016-20121227/8052_1 /TAXON_ID=342587 /ORGANISM="Karlodinium micrum, Strain CCMP2283" /LENGTH=98 /DNA_ID=CAMNT_0009273653 /DNA_START=582 /DNA_END=878 /DNA_ORIENTATION=-
MLSNSEVKVMSDTSLDVDVSVVDSSKLVLHSSCMTLRMPRTQGGSISISKKQRSLPSKSWNEQLSFPKNECKSKDPKPAIFVSFQLSQSMYELLKLNA